MEKMDLEKVHKKYRVGLTLSGGGAKGIAHVGVLKALEEFGLKPDVISGVSAGAIVGALYADGLTPDEILTFFKETKFFDYVKFTRSRFGLLNTRKFDDMLAQRLKSKTFEELKIPLFINATELIEGRNEYFFSGSLVDKVVASSSVPLFLQPKRIGNKMYVDGGIFNNMPCKVIRDMCHFQIGCHVNPVTPERITGAWSVLERVYNLSIQSSAIAERELCDMMLEPTEARNYGIFDIDHAQEIFNIGYRYTKTILKSTQIKLPE